MKDLGPLNYFLGLQVSSCSKRYYLSQAKYASDLLTHSGITDIVIAPTPLDSNVRLTSFDGIPLEDSTILPWFSLAALILTRLVILLIDDSPQLICELSRSLLLFLHYDNRSAIQIAYNDVFHERMKHIEINCHFVRHHLQSSTLCLQAISTTEQPVDIFTKVLSPARFGQLSCKLKLVSTLPP
ncbi:uncharacterized protein LOC120067570 [Benincasa hispida]|uniref:uncharacterized protein LOC120067570 n=1 Tax=Benincasa hispida TaxID=102211 RepID=UPI00190247B4|nr:uncharacterized protein LOC120067570 [Benincasa hispida]